VDVAGIEPTAPCSQSKAIRNTWIVRGLGVRSDGIISDIDPFDEAGESPSSKYETNHKHRKRKTRDEGIDHRVRAILFSER